jgi:predicted permease
MLRRRSVEREINREINSHLRLLQDEFEQRGFSPEEAGYAARRALGNQALIRETARREWGWTWLERLTQDLKYAIRAMRRKPWFTLSAVLCLALALGANDAVFAFVRGIQLKKLPVPGADRLVIIEQHNEAFHIDNCCFQYQIFEDLRRNDGDFEDLLAVLSFVEMPVSEGGRSWRLNGEAVSGNYYRMLDVRAAAGRLLDESDVTGGDGNVCVISYRMWQERFGGRPDAIGRTLEMNGTAVRIVGVSEPGFLGATLYGERDLQLPASQRGPVRQRLAPAVASLQLLGRLKPSVRREAALARLDALGIPMTRQYRQLTAEDHFLLLDGSQGFDSKKDQLGRPVLFLYLLVTLVLLVACANLAALLLVRSVERTREAGVRLAIGASRAALLRQFLCESLLISLTAGSAGWLISRALVPLLLNLLGTQASGLLEHVQPDPALFFFAAGVSAAAGLLFGVLPAWRAASSDPLPAVRGLSAGGRSSRVSHIVVAAQLALSLALVFSAGLFTGTLRNLRASGTGLHAANVATLGLDLSGIQPRTPVMNEILQRVRALPGIEAASITGTRLLRGSYSSWSLQLPGYIPPSSLTPTALIVRAGPDYFRTLGIPLTGREFTDNDRFGAEVGAAIVNTKFAREFFADADPIGREFTFGSRHVRIVGVAGITKYRTMREDPQPIFYVPFVTTNGYANIVLLQVRTGGDASKAAGQVQAVIRSIEPRIPPANITTLEAEVNQALARERILAFLSVILGGIALALSAVGFYGVVLFSVVRRMRETGIRMATGAGRGQILAQFLREHAGPLLLGLGLGLPLALGSGKLAASLLYGLKPLDARTAIAASALLIGVAACAALIPAWKATRTDPAIALRCE